MAIFGDRLDPAARKLRSNRSTPPRGVLGRKIKFIEEDGASDWPTLPKKPRSCSSTTRLRRSWAAGPRRRARRCCRSWSSTTACSSSPDPLHEGLRAAPKTSSTPARRPTQQILAGLNWIAKEKGRKSVLLRSVRTYIWPRTSNKIARKHVENVLKGKVVGEEYYALGSTQFNSVINKIKLTEADVIFYRRGRRFERRLLQAAQGGRRRPLQAGAADDLGDRG